MEKCFEECVDRIIKTKKKTVMYSDIFTALRKIQSYSWEVINICPEAVLLCALAILMILSGFAGGALK